MNVYCYLCGKEYEIMEDLGTELKVYPSCDCGSKELDEEDKAIQDAATQDIIDFERKA